jgi:hypothetical protein
MLVADEAVAARWFPLIDHGEQSRLWFSKARYRAAAAGRGAGKSEGAARIILGGDEHHRGALQKQSVAEALYVVAAPTREQVKTIWWKKLKGMVPRCWMAKPPQETELSLTLHNGATIRLVGLDRPERVEGVSIDGLVVDEFAEVRPEAWENSLQPTLNRLNRPGWALFIGRPKGRNHFYDLWTRAKTLSEWESFHWTSEPVLGAAALERQRDQMDPLSFRQEYLADWVNFEGLAYYQWDPNVHLCALEYQPARPLIFCFDFNVDPGVAAVCQEQDHPYTPTACDSCKRPFPGSTGSICAGCGIRVPPIQTTCVIGEVWIPKNSNTPAVCNRLAHDWKQHHGEVLLYGDATGGARKTSATEGTDWDLVRSYLKPTFGDRLRFRVARHNPHERDRVNTVNTRLKSAAGVVRLLVDPQKAPRVVKDFEGVSLLQGGSGELDKKASPELTHLSDGLGYYLHERHPIGGAKTAVY